jgi:SAM-dependent methyltransferase
MLRAVPYDPTIYQGAAAHYRYGRPPYSPQLEPLLAEEARLDGRGRFLDAGCGPGILTIRLAPLFEDVVGLDPDADMLGEGSRAAEGKRLANIRWVQALAEDLPAAAPGPYRLVTFGQSFHWTDEERVAEAIYDMLEPGGALALIVHTVTGRPRPPSPGPPPIPHEEIRMLVARNLGSTRPTGGGRSLGRCERCSPIGHPEDCSGTGQAAPKSSWPRKMPNPDLSCQLPASSCDSDLGRGPSHPYPRSRTSAYG